MKEIRRTFAGSSRTWMVTRKKRYTPLKQMWIANKLAKINNLDSDANVAAVAATR